MNVEQSRGKRLSLAAVVLVSPLVTSLLAAATSEHATADATVVVPQKGYAVGITSETYVDTHRSTPAWGTSPARPTRTLLTTIYYPAQGSPLSGTPQPEAAADRQDGPYPLIVFAHGLDAVPQDYSSLLSSWAAAGFVVVAPVFPLSRAYITGGPDVSDVINQPGDMSFVLSSVLRMSAQPSSPLSGMINQHEIGAAGHSNGAITTLGLVANTCCHDRRFKAAVIMAGATEPYPDGRYDLTQAPPLFFVQGTADQGIPYSGAVAMFNSARGPKGLLTIKGGDHESAAGGSASSALAVQRTTTDFFDAYLRGDKAALPDMHTAGEPSVTTLRFAATAGSTETITTIPPPKLRLHASATPTTTLTNGETVTVKWNGYAAGKDVNILECNASDVSLTNTLTCALDHAKFQIPDPTGHGTQTFEIVEGPVGNGTCDAMHPGCSIIVNNANSSAPGANIKIPIGFAR